MSRFQSETFTTATPFGVHRGRDVVYPVNAVAIPMPSVNGRPLRAVSILAMLFVVTMSASGARVAIPGLREKTRVVATRSVIRPTRGRRPVARAFYSGRRAARIVRALVARFRVNPRTWLLPARVLTPQRTSGQDASMGVPCARRWRVLGGSGRLGPGATS